MPKRAALNPIKTGRQTGSGGWKIELPRTISSSGKRERYFFATRADAEGFAQRQRKSLSLYGAQGGGILSPAAHEQSKMAIETLKPFGVPLNRVVQDWISQRRTQQKSITFEEAMDAFTASAQRSSSYLASLRQTRNRLQAFHGRLMCDITPDDVAAVLGAMTHAVRNFIIRILGGVFMHSQRRGHCEQNPAKAVGTTPDMRHADFPLRSTFRMLLFKSIPIKRIKGIKRTFRGVDILNRCASVIVQQHATENKLREWRPKRPK